MPHVIALGLLLVLVGFAFIVPRGGVSGSAAARNVSIGMHLSRTPGYQGTPSRRFRIIQVLIGLVIMAGGMLLIAMTG